VTKSGKIDWRKGKHGPRADNVARLYGTQVTLRCGHETEALPIVSSPSKLYRCPRGCGLVKRR
jgi:hypothetical protein